MPAKAHSSPLICLLTRSRLPLHSLDAVHDRHGKALAGTAPPKPERVLSPQAAFLVTSVLQGVIDRGTGRGVRSAGVEGELAGKTGTTNDQRDAWFAGYSPERASIVWVGYDDNSATALSVVQRLGLSGRSERPQPRPLSSSSLPPELRRRHW